MNHPVQPAEKWIPEHFEYSHAAQAWVAKDGVLQESARICSVYEIARAYAEYYWHTRPGEIAEPQMHLKSEAVGGLIHEEIVSVEQESERPANWSMGFMGCCPKCGYGITVTTYRDGDKLLGKGDYFQCPSCDAMLRV